MKASVERKIIRWLHIILSIPILGYIYGPVASNPPAANAVRWVFLPVVALSGFWMWKGHWLRKKLSRRKQLAT
ncbi:hypothetical protein [Chitinophaga eiseniae]|uniref:Uncharacterized protein n=1 Tax=Chitinophaga eiseniae TaxID=634771 RepID=A0A847SGF1_9BACT|nr:hypothetical protein [Chitinophaga eiseniae]NLR82330.1 hypothetical protein [Chitinophaga eiseniae]